MNKKDNYFMNQHSCFLLQYCMVLITNNKCKIINDKIKEDLIQYSKKYFQEQEMILNEIKVNTDYIQITFMAFPNMNLSKFVNAYKSASARYIRKENMEYLTSQNFLSSFWSYSYFVCSDNDAGKQAMMQYLENQEKDKEKMK